MSGTVHKLELVEVGEGFRFNPDDILEAAKGRNFTKLVVIGEFEEEDDLYLAGSANAGETLILIEQAKLDIIGR